MSTRVRRRRKLALANRRKVLSRVALLEKLEVREVPAFAIVGTELQVTGSSLDDAVSISYGPRGSGQIVATQTQFNSEGESSESKSFPLASVASIRVSLGSGDNQFVNNTNLPSKAYGGLGADLFTGGSGNDELYGGGGNDQLKGLAGNDRLDGADGIDVLEGGDGDDTLLGGNGDDNITGDAGIDQLYGQAGVDLLQGGDGNDKLWGDDGNDRLFGNNGSDILNGGAGNDTLDGGLDNDTMYGGIGLDKLVGSSGNDFLYGDADADLLYGGVGDDRVYGGAGNDKLYGNTGNDDLRGDAGADTIEGGTGSDIVYGGDDDDKLYGNAQVSNASSADGNNTIRGGNGNDQILSSAGNDSIAGEAGNDSIHAGAGNDRLWGGIGNDTLHAGDGDDEAYGDSGNDKVQGGLGNDRVEGGSDDDLLAANELRSQIDEPVVSGTDEDTAGNTLIGGSGNDRILGSDKADVLSGSDGDDWLNGLAGADELYGGNGKDVLLGGSGQDKLEGGLGIDRLVAIDGAIDQIIPQLPTSITVDRDELWIDSSDALANIAAVAKVKSQFGDAVHVVSAYRPYEAFGTEQPGPPLTWGINNFVDPDARDQHQDLPTLQTLDFGNRPLYGPNGPVWEDIDQGEVGTCYFLSRLAALAKTHPQHIRDMVTELGDGTFVVQFLNQDGNRTYVRVDGDLYITSDILYAALGTGESMWVAIVEKAWAIHRYGYATYDSISGGNGAQNDDRTETAMALGIDDVRITQTLAPTPQIFANMIKTFLNQGRGVVFGGRSFIGDDMALTTENYRRSEHILMVHSVETDSAGNVSKIRYYDLYGGPLKEMSDLDVFFYGCGGIVAFKPL